MDVIKDALLHLFRNSLAHGIESPTSREEKGKPNNGTILVYAFSRGSSTILEISDDGAGLNINRIKESMPQEDTFVSDESLAESIFKSGFSTASKTDEISGRGVGLDAVRSMLRDIGASISISFTQKKEVGFRMFKFVITLPPYLDKIEIKE